MLVGAYSYGLYGTTDRTSDIVRADIVIARSTRHFISVIACVGIVVRGLAGAKVGVLVGESDGAIVGFNVGNLCSDGQCSCGLYIGMAYIGMAYIAMSRPEHSWPMQLWPV